MNKDQFEHYKCLLGECDEQKRIAHNKMTSLNRVLGNSMKAYRLAAGVGITQMAKNLDCARSFLHDLERGYRNWSVKWLEGYQEWIEKELKKRGEG